ncbi:hypothetical protein NY588_05040 [Curtobacterium flaccumfaciens pv. beticola]|uniref:hypothetical protein n=1 Tax=Curtobacterium flaccumfaciens TaxID=2035 RepID=UPI00349F4634|nr:hypothetical protein [Curtobacterium flaccumfaciens pv. basellae]
MGESDGIDELLARARRVEAEPRTARRAVGLGTALVASGVTIAVIVSGTAYGLWITFWGLLVSAWPS